MFDINAVVVLASLLGSLFQQGPGYNPQSNFPEMTASASAPITVQVYKQTLDDESTSANPTPFTLTARDSDTYFRSTDNSTTQFANPDLTATAILEPWKTANGPVFRGSATDGTCTWDLMAEGVTVPPVAENGHPRHSPAQVYINRYKISDTQQTPYPAILADPDKEVQQTINRPAY